MAALAAAILVTLVATPAMAVELEETPETPVQETLPDNYTEYSWGFGWFVYLKFTKAETAFAATKMGAYYAGATAAAISLCALIPGFIPVLICRAGVSAVAWGIWNNFQVAKKLGQCVQLHLLYSNLLPVGSSRYSC